MKVCKLFFCNYRFVTTYIMVITHAVIMHSRTVRLDECARICRSCFYRTLQENGDVPEANPLLSLEQVIADRKVNPEEGSYTCYLFDKGLDKVLKKVGEECAETIIAAKNGDLTELNGEVNDLIYHLMVMMNICGLSLDEVLTELEARAKKIGNLKKMKVVDRNT